MVSYKTIIGKKMIIHCLSNSLYEDQIGTKIN